MTRQTQMTLLRQQGAIWKEIGDKFGVSAERARQIVRGINQIPSYQRQLVVRRDKNICLICDAIENIHIHHINGDRVNNRLDNLATLCRDCHVKVENLDRLFWKFPDKRPQRRLNTIKCLRCGREYKKYGKGIYCSQKCYLHERRKNISKPWKEMTEEEKRIARHNYYIRNKEAQDARTIFYYYTHREQIREQQRLYYKTYQRKKAAQVLLNPI